MVTPIKPLINIELNEINFDLVKKYIEEGTLGLSGFRNLLTLNNINTTSEDVYEQVEPWIQWVSVHTGLNFDEHKIFRLGDIKNTSIAQIFEITEKKGYSVGCVSPMNTSNRLQAPKYFIPDPWTDTQPDNSYLSRCIHKLIVQTVNDNAKGRIKPLSIYYLLLTFISCAQLKHYPIYLKCMLNSLNKRWFKALFFDLLIHDIHISLFKRKRPDFSTVFFNAGAHIQHHYLLYSKYVNNEASDWVSSRDLILKKQDPFGDMLLIYDFLIRDYLSLENTNLILSTGLTQIPYDRTKYYYRLKTHSEFLTHIGISHLDVYPRMTRDFLVTFETTHQAVEAESRLSLILINDTDRMFDSIDNRGTSLFVTLTYPKEITSTDFIKLGDVNLSIQPHVVFVAIKNAMHSSKGFAFFSKDLQKIAPSNGSHVKSIFDTMDAYLA